MSEMDVEQYVASMPQGMGGLMAMTGHEGGGPMRAGIAVADMAAG